jgi:diguanylate cyclase (GGDEF)-like protein
VQGAAAVDGALAWIASQISEVVDGQGPIGRLEGGAFAVYLPNYTLPRALRLAEQVRDRISRTRHDSSFRGHRLTVSVGVAALRPGEPCGNLLEAAEQACRKAKQGGRDAIAQR